MARDSSRDETQKLHKKWLKHQAFMAELAQNKEWLDKIEKVSFDFIFSYYFLDLLLFIDITVSIRRPFPL